MAAFPLFADLGDDYLWSDEGDTAVLATSILKHGVPKAWDGTTFTDSDFGTRLNKNLVMVSHPWLQYYVAAASFYVFGETAFAARFPFALAGLITIPVLFVLIVRLTQDRRAALTACILLLLSVQFLLFSRQSRNYPLHMLLTCVLLLLFFRLTDRRGCILFSVTGILLFHCHPSGVAPLGALALLTFMKPFACYRRWFWIASPFIATLTLPWIAMAKMGYGENTSMLSDWEVLAPRLVQFLIECASIVPIAGMVALFIWIWVRQWRQEDGKSRSFSFKIGRKVSAKVFEPGERSLVVAIGMIFFFYAALITVTQSRSEMFGYGLRYVTPVIPLGMALAGILVSKASRANPRVWLVLITLLAVTKVGRITPWSFLHESRSHFDGTGFAAMHVPNHWMDRVFKTGLISFSQELWRSNRGTVARVCEVLETNAAPDDVLVTNYEWEPLYFHTRLPQGLKIMPHYPIYPIAKEHDLPPYVFSLHKVRWFVCRWPWDGYRGYDLQAIGNALLQAGATLTPIATVRETTWENRPERHYHRYPGKVYMYPWFEGDARARAEIYRVDWPDEPFGDAVARSDS